MNWGANKKQVAMQKIVSCHYNLDMSSLLKWDLKALPLAVSWFDSACSAAEQSGQDRKSVQKHRLSSLFHFAKALPEMILPSTKMAGAKRKGDELNHSSL